MVIQATNSTSSACNFVANRKHSTALFNNFAAAVSNKWHFIFKNTFIVNKLLNGHEKIYHSIIWLEDFPKHSNRY